MQKEDKSGVPEATIILENTIKKATSSLKDIELNFHDVEGINSITKLLKIELRKLEKLRSKSDIVKSDVEPCNVERFRDLLKAARKHAPCTAICKTFTEPGNKDCKLIVDLIAGNGAVWVKVISRNPRGLAKEFSVCSKGRRTIIESAELYIRMAEHFEYFFKKPTVVFDFVNGLPDALADKLETMGITVQGTKISISDLAKIPATVCFGEMDEKTSALKMQTECNLACTGTDELRHMTIVNLDVSAAITLISSLTNDKGRNYQYSKEILNLQAALEAEKPALQPLKEAIQGKMCIMCHTAYIAFNSILNNFAGPTEKERGEKLLEEIVVVEDRLTDRAKSLKLSRRLKERSQIIFGTGDYHKAVTLTSDRHFVKSAALQGVYFAAIFHERRILSEKDQLPLES